MQPGARVPETSNFTPPWMLEQRKPGCAPRACRAERTKTYLSLVKQITKRVSSCTETSPRESLEGPRGLGVTPTLPSFFTVNSIQPSFCSAVERQSKISPNGSKLRVPSHLLSVNQPNCSLYYVHLLEKICKL